MLQKTPPMGWNTWNTFGPKINDALIRESADSMVATGLADAGYRYIVIDDCWALKERDENGRLVPDPEKFPYGMKALSDYIHSKGLLFGMYSCAGTLTCAGYPASYDYEYIDAETFAEWGVDFLKYDYCHHTPVLKAKYLYRRMGTALANCGRDILFSACSWGVEETPTWIKTTSSQMWRSTGDIHDSWDFIKKLTLQQEEILAYNALGCFNDMDMLIVGMGGKGNVGINSGCTTLEYRTHFSLWAMLASPLMIGCDIRNMTNETKEILLNKEVIAINQDPCCYQTYTITTFWPNDLIKVYVRPLENGDFAICTVNLTDADAAFSFGFDELGVSKVSGKSLLFRDLWTKEEFLPKNHVAEITLPAHGCRLFRCRLV